MAQELDIKYTQNFIHYKPLIQSILRKYTSIGKEDLVVEIGTGSGNITFELAKVCKEVVGFEIDPELYSSLKNQLKIFNIENVKLLNIDFLKADMIRYGKFKIFANIPFFLTSHILRKILIEKNNLSLAYIFMEKDAAFRYIGEPYRKESLLSLALKLNWEIKIIYNFLNTDFKPVPKASIVLVSFKRKVDNKEVNNLEFQDFLAYLFNQRKGNIKQSLLSIFSFTQVKQIKAKLKLNWEQTVRDISFEDWMYIYQLSKKIVDKDKFGIVFGSFSEFSKQQVSQNKDRKLTILNF